MNAINTALPTSAPVPTSWVFKPKKDRLHIRITAEKVNELHNALAEVQTGDGQNDICVGRLLLAVGWAEQAIELTGLSKSARRGATFTYADAGASCRAYHYGIPTTRVVLRRDARGWVLADVTRTKKYPRASQEQDVSLSEVQASALQGDMQGARWLRVRNGNLARVR